MKQFFLLLFSITLLLACKSNDTANEATADSDLDAARSFLQASLRRKWDVAQQYMLPDAENKERLEAVSRVDLPVDEKQGLWDASINIHRRNLLNDSTSIIVYSNSYHKGQRDSLKVVKQQGKWLVDFKYLFKH